MYVWNIGRHCLIVSTEALFVSVRIAPSILDTRGFCQASPIEGNDVLYIYMYTCGRASRGSFFCWLPICILCMICMFIGLFMVTSHLYVCCFCYRYFSSRSFVLFWKWASLFAQAGLEPVLDCCPSKPMHSWVCRYTPLWLALHWYFSWFSHFLLSHSNL